MSIRKYIAYLRTVETGSITQAANELGYTQSAVSKMISLSLIHISEPTRH